MLSKINERYSCFGILPADSSLPLTASLRRAFRSLPRVLVLTSSGATPPRRPRPSSYRRREAGHNLDYLYSYGPGLFGTMICLRTSQTLGAREFHVGRSRAGF